MLRPRVLSTKLTEQEFAFCQELSVELHKQGLLQKPTNSELVRLLITELAAKLKMQTEANKQAKMLAAATTSASNIRVSKAEDGSPLLEIVDPQGHVTRFKQTS